MVGESPPIRDVDTNSEVDAEVRGARRQDRKGPRIHRIACTAARGVDGFERRSRDRVANVSRGVEEVELSRYDFATWRLSVNAVVRNDERQCSRKDAKTQRIQIKNLPAN